MQVTKKTRRAPSIARLRVLAARAVAAQDAFCEALALAQSKPGWARKCAEAVPPVAPTANADDWQC